MPPDDHRYGDKEIGKILRRASEIQRSEPTAPDPSGLTLAELEEVAREAGIDAANVRRAASEIEAGRGADLGARFVGGAIRVRLERAVDGELPTEEFAGLVPLIQAAADSAGQASMVGGTLSWSSQTSGNMRSLQVLVMARDGQTIIRLEERMDGLAWSLHGGIIGGVGGGLGFGLGIPLGLAMGSTLAAVGLPAAIIASSYWLARRIYRHVSLQRGHTLEELMDRLEHIVRRRAGPRLEHDSTPRLTEGP